MSNRIKLPPTKLSRAAAEQLMADIARLTIERRKLQNAMDADITEIRGAYEEGLTQRADAIRAATVQLESWASANPEEFPKGRKSLEMTHGVLGYRTGTPKLKTLAKWTWDRVLEKLRSAGMPFFIRTKEEVDKESILASAADGTVEAAALRELGLQVVQEEAFFVDPKVEDQDARSTQEVAK